MVKLHDGVARNALVILAVIACGAAMFWLRGIFTPLVLAIFLAVLIDGFARKLRERLSWFPDALALPTAIVVSILFLIGAGIVIAENATSFASQLINYTPRLNDLLTRGANALHVQAPPPLEQLVREFNPAKYGAVVAQSFQNFAGDAFFVLIYLGFIIASRRGFKRKMVAMFRNGGERDRALEAFQEIRGGVESYLWVQTVTGLMIAVGSWIVMAILGLDNAFFWAFLIFVASYIPIIGGVIGIALPPVFALVQFPTLWQAIVIYAVLQTIQFIVGNIVQPRMQGESMNIDPVVVLLSLAFWGALWGMTGMFLSTPLTVTAMVILAQFKGSRWVAILLSGNGDPGGKAKKTERVHRNRTPAT